jgi:hypothetical protein
MKVTSKCKMPEGAADEDREYADFFRRCEHLSHSICDLIGRVPDPRELDKILLWWSRKNPAARDYGIK